MVGVEGANVYCVGMSVGVSVGEWGCGGSSTDWCVGHPFVYATTAPCIPAKCYHPLECTPM